MSYLVRELETLAGRLEDQDDFRSANLVRNAIARLRPPGPVAQLRRALADLRARVS